MEDLLAKYGKRLHRNNGLMTRVKYNLCGLYGRAPGYLLFNLDRKQLKRKRDLCEEMMEVLDILQPGITSRRGLILYELHTALLLCGKMDLSTHRDRASNDLKKSLECLKESLDILHNEPADTFPGQLYAGVMQSAPQIEAFITDLLK